jgi:hypothetical protein
MGMFLVRGVFLRLINVSKPLALGISMSRVMASGRSLSAFSSASAAELVLGKRYIETHPHGQVIESRS